MISAILVLSLSLTKGDICDICTVTVPDQKVISAILVLSQSHLSLSLTKGDLCDTCTVIVPDQKVISAILVLSLSLTKR